MSGSMLANFCCQIRLACPNDIATYCRLWNTVWPHLKITTAGLERDRTSLPSENQATIWLAFAGDEPIGFAECHREMGSYHPRKWTTSFAVNDEYRNLGVGRALYQTLEAFVHNQDPICLYSRAVESEVDALEFLDRRGFCEVKRDFESKLELESLPAEILDAMDDPEATIVSARELDSIEFRQELHQVFEAVRIDTPRADPPTPMAFDAFNEVVLNDPELLWEGTHIALDGGKIAGFSGLYRSEGDGELFQWLTAVKRENRGKGLAQAIKARAARWAIQNGYKVVRTDNDTRNAPMLAINDKMGYERLLGMVTLVKTYES